MLMMTTTDRSTLIAIARGLGFPRCTVANASYTLADEAGWIERTRILGPADLADLMRQLDEVRERQQTAADRDAKLAEEDAFRDEQRQPLDPDDIEAQQLAREAEEDAATAARGEWPMSRAQGDRLISLLEDVKAALEKG